MNGAIFIISFLQNLQKEALRTMQHGLQFLQNERTSGRRLQEENKSLL